jgi:hypothetical protein
MLDFDSDAVFGAQSSLPEANKRRAPTCGRAVEDRVNLPKIQPFPNWARLSTHRVDDPDATADAAFAAGASLALFDPILRSGADGSSAGIRAADGSSARKSSGEGGVEPVFTGALRQRLALRAATACGAIARHREDEGALRDAEHLAGFDAALTPAGRLHRLWRLFATRPPRWDEQRLRAAADLVDLPPDTDCAALAALVHEAAPRQNPVVAAARANVRALQILDDAPQIDAEIFAVWIADLVLARQMRWDAPLPLLATTIMHPSLRAASSRRPRPSDPDWSASVARAYARASQEAYALAGELSRRSETLLRAAPKLRAKGAARVIELLLGDDCVAPVRAAKSARLSDRAARRLFDRLLALGAVREVSGRANFRLYGL